MKKRLLVSLLISVLILSFATPVMAITDVTSVESMNIVAEQEISPFTEMTRIYLRTYNGNIQWRLWGMTSGRWLTEWADM